MGREVRLGRVRSIGAAFSRRPPWPGHSRFMMGLTASGWPIARALPAASRLIGSSWKLGPGSRVPLLGLLLIGSVALPALAYASLPDPLWIPGIYDDADYDDVVTLATSAAGCIAPALRTDVAADPPLVGSVPRLVQTGSGGPVSSAVHSRGPPAS